MLSGTAVQRSTSVIGRSFSHDLWGTRYRSLETTGKGVLSMRERNARNERARLCTLREWGTGDGTSVNQSERNGASHIKPGNPSSMWTREFAFIADSNR